jgi:Spy/CpxP family protein refolding chaperone
MFESHSETRKGRRLGVRFRGQEIQDSQEQQMAAIEQPSNLVRQDYREA